MIVLLMFILALICLAHWHCFYHWKIQKELAIKYKMLLSEDLDSDTELRLGMRIAQLERKYQADNYDERYRVV